MPNVIKFAIGFIALAGMASIALMLYAFVRLIGTHAGNSEILTTPYGAVVICHGPDGSVLRSPTERKWRFDSQGYYFVPATNVQTVFRPREGDACDVTDTAGNAP